MARGSNVQVPATSLPQFGDAYDQYKMRALVESLEQRFRLIRAITIMQESSEVETRTSKLSQDNIASGSSKQYAGDLKYLRVQATTPVTDSVFVLAGISITLAANAVREFSFTGALTNTVVSCTTGSITAFSEVL